MAQNGVGSLFKVAYNKWINTTVDFIGLHVYLLTFTTSI